MRTRLLLTIGLMMLWVCLPLGATRYQVMSTSGSNVRLAPNSKAKLLGSLPYESWVEVVSMQDGWAKIEYQGQTAYVFAKYLQPAPEPEPVVVAPVVAPEPEESFVLATDIIITNKSEKVEAKITEVGPTEVRYKKASNPDGPTFVLNASDINTILYANGEVQVMESAQPQAQQTPVLASRTLVRKPLFKPNPTRLQPRPVSSARWRNYLQMDLFPSVHFGYSGLLLGFYHPTPTCGWGIEAVYQLRMKESYNRFIRKGYFSEVSMGYAMKGCAAHPIHCFDLRFMPAGYWHTFESKDVSLYGTAGLYVGASDTYLTEGKYRSYFSNSDVGFSMKAAVEYRSFQAGVSYEVAFYPIIQGYYVNRPVDLYNTGVQFHFAYKLYNITDNKINRL